MPDPDISVSRYADLRAFIALADELGVLRRIEGADPVHELGAITEVAAGSPECPALLFDSIKGYAKGFRIFTNATVSPQRAALALGIDPKLPPVDALKEWKHRLAALAMLPPRTVKDGPEGPFSLLPIWKALGAEGRVHGVAPPGLWMHVGDPAAKLAAEARLAGDYPGAGGVEDCASAVRPAHHVDAIGIDIGTGGEPPEGRLRPPRPLAPSSARPGCTGQRAVVERARDGERDGEAHLRAAGRL